jgi:hypothetical protein
MEGDLGPRDAAAGNELGELGLIAKDERRCQHVCCLTPALSVGDLHHDLVPAGVLDRRPGGHRQPSPWRERAPHLAEGGHAVREIHERELADHDVAPEPACSPSPPRWRSWSWRWSWSSPDAPARRPPPSQPPPRRPRRRRRRRSPSTAAGRGSRSTSTPSSARATCGSSTTRSRTPAPVPWTPRGCARRSTTGPAAASGSGRPPPTTPAASSGQGRRRHHRQVQAPRRRRTGGPVRRRSRRRHPATRANPIAAPGRAGPSASRTFAYPQMSLKSV